MTDETFISNVPDLLAGNARFAETFDRGHLDRPPKRRVAIVCCLDARIDPRALLGWEPGDAVVIRNAGGRAADALRSLVVAHLLLGIREIVVIHHNDCGLHAFTDEAIRVRLRDKLGVDAPEIDFDAFDDLDQSVRDDLVLLQTSPLIPDDMLLSGFVYDVTTGRLRAVTVEG